jgi:energy-coupling factor transport system permease protein
MMLKVLAIKMHPSTWWVLAISLAVVAGTATNIVQTVSIAASSVLLILIFRENAPWARSLKFYLLLAVAVVVIRVLFRIVFSFSKPTDDVLLNLPSFELNFGLGAIGLLGDVSAAALNGALLDGSRLAAIILAIAVANTLANPRKLLKSAPGALYEIATSVSVAINLAPQLIESFARVKRARGLRGKGAKTSTLNGLLIPVLEDTLDRSLLLAASMDARGFGRKSSQSKGELLLARLLGLQSLLAITVGVFTLLSGFSPTAALVLLLVGLVTSFISVRITSRRNSRTSISRTARTWVDFVVLTICGTALALNFATAVSLI